MRKIFILSAIIVLSTIFIYTSNKKDEKRIEITSISSIDVFKFNSYTKFSNEKIGNINENEKLEKFKSIINSLDNSKGIERVDYPENINISSFKHSIHVKPNLRYIENNIEEDGSFLLHIFIEDSTKKSYIIFSGNYLTYVLDESNTRILNEIFKN